MDKILVTGATGFVGSWMARKLIQKGHHVKILRRKTSSTSLIDDLPVEHAIGDVTDLESLKAATKDVKDVFHLAGLVGYTPAMRQKMVMVNVIGTSNVVDACISNNVERFLHMSSVATVGASVDGKILLTEESPYTLEHLDLGYFETKRKAEQLVLKAVKNNQLNAVIVNPATIYGPGDAQKGSRSTQLKVAKGQFPFYSCGGLNVIGVEDVVEAIYNAWKLGRTGERYILGGENLTVKQLFHHIAEAAQVSPPKIYLPKWTLHTIGWLGDRLEKIGKKGPITSENAWTSTLFHWFDSSKAKKELGLHAKPAKEAIIDSVQWIKENNLLE